MSEEPTPLKPGDGVYIPKLKMYGKVLHVLEDGEDSAYKIQIEPRYFRRTDLEPYDPVAERQKQEAARKQKIERLEAANERLKVFLAGGGDLNSPAGVSLGIEMLEASNAVWVELGHDPFLVPVNDPKNRPA